FSFLFFFSRIEGQTTKQQKRQNDKSDQKEKGATRPAKNKKKKRGERRMSTSRVAPAWLRPIGRVFPRVVIDHVVPPSAHAAHSAHTAHAAHAAHVASELGVTLGSLARAVAFRDAEHLRAEGAERSEEDRRAGEAGEAVRREEDRSGEGAGEAEGAERSEEGWSVGGCNGADSEEETFGLLSVRSLSDVSDVSCATDFRELHDEPDLSLSPSGGLDGATTGPFSGAPFTGADGLSSVGAPFTGASGLNGLSGASGVSSAAYEDHVRFIAQADAENMQRRHVTGAGVYYFPRFSSATEERRAQKAPRRACIELGETVFSFGTVMYDGDVELTFLGHRVASTRRGDFNARVERRGNALLVVAVDQILVFREIVVDGTWMDTMAL
ncbi:MAG: hypothetical protein EBZ77_10515, partial [Chitinophagia bacterium]|nr:hypothetical protein [Chitinophagia bacterium]